MPVASLEHVEPGQVSERAPGEAVADPEAEQRVGVRAEVGGDVGARGLGEVDGGHGQEEAKEVVAILSAQVDLDMIWLDFFG